MGKHGRPAVDCTGQQIGIVRVLERRGADRHGQALWLVECVGDAETAGCGVRRVVSRRNLEGCPPKSHVGCRRAANNGRAVSPEPAPAVGDAT
jgi:hypothetical protein